MSRRISLMLAALAVISQVGLLAARPAAARQVDGNTYVSPNFGWSISWDDSWSVSEEDSEDGYDYLVLEDALNIVYFEAYEGYDGDPEACVEDELAWLEENFDNVEVGTDDDGEPLTGSDSTGAYAVYTFTIVSTEDEDIVYDVVEYSDCRTLVEGEAVLEISQVAVLEAYNEAIPTFRDLIENLAMPGEEPADEPDGEERDAPGPDDGELTADEARELVDVSSEELTEYWTEVFADYDLFYVPPFYVIVEDTTEIPCDGGTTHPGSGSFYCPLNQTIYFDMTVELSDAQGFGRASVYYTLGHESGHDVQMQLGVTLAGTMTVEMELEADCMAGAYLATVVDAGDLTEDEFFNLLSLVEQFGDPEGMSATDDRSHGLGSQRVSMVLRGYYEGVDACGTF